MGSFLSLIHPIHRETCVYLHDDISLSQTSAYPPFEPPASNASTFDSGFLMIDGQEIFWRYFFPNTSIMQPKNFRFSFEIWWENPDSDIDLVVDLSENEGESNSTSYYETLVPYEKILETPEGEFIHYAVWMNSTYFFMNETWASFGNEFIDEESLNLTVGIQHFVYFPIFEYTILRETSGPEIQIIHQNYDESENKLTLNLSNTSFEIVVTGLSYIKYVELIVTFLNQTTLEIEEVISRPMEVTQEPGMGTYYVPSLITTKVNQPDAGGGLMDIDTESPITASLVVVDGYGYATTKSMSILLEILYSNTTTTITPTDGNWGLMNPVIGAVSIMSVVVVILGIWKVRK